MEKTHYLHHKIELKFDHNGYALQKGDHPKADAMIKAWNELAREKGLDERIEHSDQIERVNVTDTSIIYSYPVQIVPLPGIPL